MKAKKTIALAIAAAVILSLAGCGKTVPSAGGSNIYEKYPESQSEYHCKENE